MLSSPARYIQPADPVCQLQPPRPACGARVDVAGDDVRLEAITGGLFSGPRMVDRVEHVEQLHGFVAAAKRRHRHDDPHRGVGILPAVLPHARRIALDVPGLLRRTIEGRAEEQQRL